MVAVKICGMRDLANIAQIGNLRPDYMGFICWRGSPRFVDQVLTGADLEGIIPGLVRVGVFVNQSVEEIDEWVKRLGLSVVQLHGDESPEFCDQLRQRISVSAIWKAIQVADEYPLALVERYQDSVDMLLFDTKTCARGGSGVAFGWELLERYNAKNPIILSGGIGSENIEQALKFCRGLDKVSVLDLNSRLESAAGIKDFVITKGVLATIRESSSKENA